MALAEQYATHVANSLASTATVMPAPQGANLFMSLHTEDPTPDCSLGELVGSGYLRTAISFDAVSVADSINLENNAPVIFPAATATIVDDVEFYGIWDDQLAGEPIAYGKLASPIVWTNLASVAFQTGMLVLELYTKPATCTIP